MNNIREEDLYYMYSSLYFSYIDNNLMAIFLIIIITLMSNCVCMLLKCLSHESRMRKQIIYNLCNRDRKSFYLFVLKKVVLENK